MDRILIDMTYEYFILGATGGSEGDLSESWDLSIDFKEYEYWQLQEGRRVELPSPFTGIVDSLADATDFPFADHLVHIHSLKMQKAFRDLGVHVQYVPINIVSRLDRASTAEYAIANYLDATDCLDRINSVYELWTKETLMFWEDRPWMLETYRDIRRPVLRRSLIGERKAFWLKGSSLLIVNSQVVDALRNIKITGARFRGVHVSDE
jgi:hypothetical protein